MTKVRAESSHTPACGWGSGLGVLGGCHHGLGQEVTVTSQEDPHTGGAVEAWHTEGVLRSLGGVGGSCFLSLWVEARLLGCFAEDVGHRVVSPVGVPFAWGGRSSGRGLGRTEGTARHGQGTGCGRSAAGPLVRQDVVRARPVLPGPGAVQEKYGTLAWPLDIRASSVRASGWSKSSSPERLGRQRPPGEPFQSTCGRKPCQPRSFFQSSRWSGPSVTTNACRLRLPQISASANLWESWTGQETHVPTRPPPVPGHPRSSLLLPWWVTYQLQARTTPPDSLLLCKKTIQASLIRVIHQEKGPRHQRPGAPLTSGFPAAALQPYGTVWDSYSATSDLDGLDSDAARVKFQHHSR